MIKNNQDEIMQTKEKELTDFMEDKFDIKTVSITDLEYTFVFGIKDHNFVIGCMTREHEDAAFEIIPFTIDNDITEESHVVRVMNSDCELTVTELLPGLEFNGKYIHGTLIPIPE